MNMSKFNAASKKSFTSIKLCKKQTIRASFYQETKNLIERAKEELEKERRWKKMCTLKKSIKTKESNTNTIHSFSTNYSDKNNISRKSTNSFKENQRYFTNDIIDYNMSSRENLFLITKQFSEILNKIDNKKQTINKKKKHLNIQI